MNTLPLFQVSEEQDRNVEFLVRLLDGKDWMTANQIAQYVTRATGVTWNDRQVRALASASNGRIAGGQRGYKLVKEMTKEEYEHYRNWMKSQADEMTARILKSDRIFYGRQPVESGNGIL